MNRTLVIASRELRERSRIFLMAAALAVLPFLSALVPAARNDRPMVIAGMGGFLGLALALGVAIAMGTSTVSGELVARRLSFYFSKPVSPAAIWFGKALGAIATSVLCFTIVAVPSFLATGSQWQRTFGAARLLTLYGILAVTMFLISHTLSTMVRSRSALVGLDFVLAALTAFALFFIIRPLLFSGMEQAIALVELIGAALVVVLLAAPVWQLAQGRSDIRRSHAALSRAVWTGVAVIVLVAGAYAAWLTHAAPSDLKSFRIVQSPGSSAVFVGGTARGRGDYYASFLVDPDSGRYERVSAVPWWGEKYSRDGKVVAWLAPVWSGLTHGGAEIYTKRLDRPDAPAQATGIQQGRTFSLSPDGSRVAVLSSDNLSVHDVGTQRLLASVHCDTPAMNAASMFFVDNDVVRIYEWPYRKGKLEIFELDTRTKSLTKTGEAASDAASGGVRVSADGSRIVIARDGIVADGRTGATIVQLPMTANGRFHAAVLSDGTIAMIHESKLSLFAPDGTPRHQVPLPTFSHMITAETDGQKLIILGADKPAGGHRVHTMTLVIDTARGVIERTISNVRGPLASGDDTRFVRFQADEKLVAVNDQGELVTWNARTGEVAKIGR